MAKKPKQSADDIELERLEEQRRKISKRITKKRESVANRRGLAGFRDQVTEVTEQHNERVQRLTSYDTNDKARTFGFGAFDDTDGALRWVRMDAVYAIEVVRPDVDAGKKAITLLKTVDGPVDVSQSADEVVNEFIRVRHAFSAEGVRELQSELIRREEKVEKAKAKAKKKAAKKSGDAPAGPDFQKVSDQVSADTGSDADRGEDLGDIDPVDEHPDQTGDPKLDTAGIDLPDTEDKTDD